MLEHNSINVHSNTRPQLALQKRKPAGHIDDFENIFDSLGHPQFFSFSIKWVSWCWVCRSDWKKKRKKNHKSQNMRPWYPRMTLKVNIQNPQYIVKNVPVFVPVFLYAVTMLIFQIKRIISSEKWFNYVITFFFFENAKNLVGQMMLNRERKQDGLS